MSITKLRVHVAPVGFEIDRVVLSAKMAKADKVWLLVHDNPSEDKATPFIDKITKLLRKEKIKVELLRANRTDLFAIIKAVKEIIEKENGNDVYVNVASGSKIQAIACMMACMMFNDKKNVNPFYAHAEEYLGFEGKEQSKGVKELQPLPTYDIHRPRPELIQALKLIKDYGKKMPKKLLAELAEKNGLIVVNAQKKNFELACFASLDKNIIQPLQDQWKFVEVEKIGRSRYVKITDAGIKASELLI